MAKLKTFITESSDKFRRPYAMKPMVYPRRTYFYATVNNGDFKISLNVELIVEREFDWERDNLNWNWKPTAEICSKLNINSTSSLKTSLLKYGTEYKRSNGRRGYITPPYKCPLLSGVI